VSCNRNVVNNSKIADRVFFYEPSVSTVNGIITKEVHYGPPNFGENPETDSKDTIYVVALIKKISVYPSRDTEKENSNTDSLFNIDKMQVIGLDKKTLENNIGKEVKLTGTLFEAISGNHYTKVLINVRK